MNFTFECLTCKGVKLVFKIVVHLSLLNLQILLPDQDIKGVTETSKPVDTRQDKALSLTFFPKQRKRKSVAWYQPVLAFQGEDGVKGIILFLQPRSG